MREAIPPALAGERLDRVVAMLTGASRSEAAALVDRGAVALDDAVVTSRSQRVSAGAVVEVEVPEPAGDGRLVPDPWVEVPVVHEDPDLLVVDKPAGLVVHPGAGQRGGTMVHGLLARYPEIAEVGEPDRPGIVHRIDKGTSGLLLVARSQPAYEGLVEMLSAHLVDRRYRALVWGRVEAPTGEIDAPIGRSQRDRTRMAVTLRGREALTRYEVRQRFELPVPTTELACTLATGRTHQIRVHMASIGHPVVGDERYGGRRSTVLSGGADNSRLSSPAEPSSRSSDAVSPGLRLRAQPLRRQWLHAEHLGLEHPVTGEALAFDSPIPDDLQAVLDDLAAESARQSPDDLAGPPP